MGTRHRAAFGVASETDAVAVVVSEETGNVTVFYEPVGEPRGIAVQELRDTLGMLSSQRRRRPDARA